MFFHENSKDKPSILYLRCCLYVYLQHLSCAQQYCDQLKKIKLTFSYDQIIADTSRFWTRKTPFGSTERATKAWWECKPQQTLLFHTTSTTMTPFFFSQK